MTTKQRNVMEQMLADGGKKPLSQYMRGAGYSEAMARNSQKLKNSKTFAAVLAEIDDTEIIEAVRETALDKTDKRAHLQAAQMILNLKDRFPAGKLKVQAYNEEVDSLKATPLLLDNQSTQE